MSRKPDIVTLKKRAEFLAVAASGKKWVTPGLLLQIRKREEGCPSKKKEAPSPARSGDLRCKSGILLPLPQGERKFVLRFGLTASRKVGGAVARNRARRRLRALAREVLAAHAPLDYDYVLIARPATVTRPYDDLRNDLILALKRLKAYK